MTSQPFDADPRRMRFILEVRQLGVTDARILAAIERTSRADFAALHLEPLAWDDVALPLDCGQTLTKPTTIASMVAALAPRPQDKVLEIGTGSGYQTAILSRLCAHVDTLERYRTLAAAARDRLAALGRDNARVMVADGAYGWPEEGPYDRIAVNGSVAAPNQDLFDQLAPEGVLVAPVGAGGGQRLQRFYRRPDGALAVEDWGPARYTPLEEGVAQEL